MNPKNWNKKRRLIYNKMSYKFIFQMKGVLFMNKQKSYNAELKIKIVKEYLCGNLSYDNIAKKYNISSSTQIKKWVKQYKEFGEEYFYTEHRGRKKQNKKNNLDEMTIEEQNHYLRMENDILKKAIALNLI